MVPGTDQGERPVGDSGEEDERRRLAPRNLLGPLDPLGLLELVLTHL